MEPWYATIDEPATTDYVLEVLRDMHRQWSQFDPEVDSDAKLSFGTTVAEWRAACHLLSWRQLGRAYNQFWGMQCSDADWHEVLEPPRQRQLSEVCQLIARHATVPRIRPARLLGTECLPGGTFLTIRSLLHEAGEDANEIRPSTLLASFTRRYCEVFLGPISRLAPGALPPVRIRTPLYDATIWTCMTGALMLVIGSWVSLPLLTIAGVVVFVLSYAATWITARCFLPASVEFGHLRTFRDLALVINGACQR
jgi:hypothetical protein